MAKAKKLVEAKKSSNGARPSANKMANQEKQQQSATRSAKKEKTGITHLQPGMKAPNFKGVDSQGNTVKLADFKGKKLALYFYPHDMTPTCTVQACNFRDNYQLLQKHGIEVVGISVDDVASHQKFIHKHQLPFTLLADPEKTILQRYGVWGEKLFMGKKIIGTHRTTFLIDEKGIIAHIIHKPQSKDHAAEILAAWQQVEGKD